MSEGGERELLKQTTVYNASLHLHAKFHKCQLKVVLYLPSALSQVTTRSLLCYERMLSTRVSNVARVSLSNVLRLVGVVFGPALLS